MFIGEYRYAIDDKGRLSMPARFRDELGETFIVTKGLDRCLWVFPLEEWRQLDARLRSLPLTSPNVRLFTRAFYAGASECRLDGQGRVLLPTNLREHAGLRRDAVVVGMSSRVEIWAQEEWERYMQDEPGLERIAGEIGL